MNRRLLLKGTTTFAMAFVMGCATAANPPLRGTLWTLGPLGNSPVPSLKLELQASRFSGQANCNRISGSFTLDGNKLSFGSVMSTRRACYPDDGSEERFLKAVSEVRSWRVEGGQLLLLSDTGAPVLRLQASADKP
ncbi:MAG: META domain-containing protein [Rubrivivax sp.]|nr:META domain-containing protein [Rubrivivax sp.]MDP3610324.1 META domain-containing protein [Rubrivivax sp.]